MFLYVEIHRGARISHPSPLPASVPTSDQPSFFVEDNPRIIPRRAPEQRGPFLSIAIKTLRSSRESDNYEAFAHNHLNLSAIFTAGIDTKPTAHKAAIIHRISFTPRDTLLSVCPQASYQALYIIP